MADKTPAVGKKPMFKFVMDPDITITNKQTLSKLASRRMYEGLAFANRSLMELEKSIVWLRKLDEIENQGLSMELLVEPDEAYEEQQLRKHALTTLMAVQKALSGLKERRLGVASLMEADFDQMLKSAKNKAKLKKGGRKRDHIREIEESAELGPEPNPEAGSLLTAPVTVAAPVSQPPARPSAPKELILDPKLLEQARREMARIREEPGN